MLSLMLCKSMLHMKGWLWWWKSVFHVSLCLFILMSFMSLVFSYGLWNDDIMLYSLLETWGMFGMRRKDVYVSWVMLYVFWVKLCQKDERTSEDYVWVLLENGNRRGPWGLIGGEYGVNGTFPLDSQPLVDFFYFFWSMSFSNPLYM